MAASETPGSTGNSASAARPRVIGSAVFFVGMMVTAIVFAPLTVLAWPLPFPMRFKFVSQWARFNLWSLKLCCGLSFEVEGRENIPAQAAIAFCKHQSAWETLAMQLVLPAQAWVLKRELLRVPFFGWGLAVVEPIAIDRDAGRKAVAQVIDQGRQRLADNRWIVIFPEGTRVAVGKPTKFGVGGALLASKTKADVLPIAHNAGCYWPRRGFLKRPGVIKMVIGRPIPSNELTAKEINTRAKEWIDRKTAELETGC